MMAKRNKALNDNRKQPPRGRSRVIVDSRPAIATLEV